MAESGTNGLGGGETTHQLYMTAVRKCEALKEEYEALHKRYADLMSSHGATVSQLEVSQEEQSCLRKRYDDVCMELKGALRERNGLQQQCTAAIRQWDNALRERNEAKEQLAKVQQQRDEAMKEITNAMAFRIKATKDLSRLAEERNATFKEYSLVMSERDTVHKEIERLQEELTATSQKLLASDNKRKAALEEIESLRREITAVLQDRDQALKQCNDLREKYGDSSIGLLGADNRCDWSSSLGDTRWDKVLDSQHSEHGGGSLSHGGSSMSSWEQNKGSLSKASQRLDDLDQANREIESLRRLSDRLQVELTEAQQEAEVCKRRRDWAFSERDKIVLERESIRTLCDKLRRERDRAVSDLAEALRDSDDVKRQKNDTLKELKELREKMEAQLEKETRLKQLHSVGGTNNYSRDSAIDADLQEGDSETLDITLRDFTMVNPGFEITKASDLLFPGEAQNGTPQLVIVSSISKGSAADGRLRVNDCIIKINGVETTGLDFKSTLDLLKASGSTLNMVVKRRRPLPLRSGVHTVTWQLANSQGVGLTLESGIYVNGISPGSLSAQDGSISLGDRLISVNGQSLTSLENAQLLLGTALKSGAGANLTLCFLRCSPFSSSPSSSCSSGNNLLEKVDMALALQLRNNNNRDSPMTVKSSPEDNKKAPVCLVSSSVQTDTSPVTPCSKASPFNLPTSQASSSSSSSSRTQLPPTEPQPSTLLDRAYHKIFGERRRDSKKQFLSSSVRHHHHHHHHSRDDDYEAIAELDSVLDNYSQTLNTKPPVSSSSKRKESNGGTWPKYKGAQFHNTEATGTVTSLQPHKRKERKPLSSVTKQHFYEMKGNSEIAHNHSSKGNFIIAGERMTSEQLPRTLPRSRERMTLFVPSPEPSINGSVRSSAGTDIQLSSPPPPPRISSSGSSSYTSPDCSSPQKVSMGCHSNDHSVSSAPRIHYSGATSPESCLDYSVVSAHRDKDVLEYYKNRNRPRPKSAHYVLSDSECLSSLDSNLSCCKPHASSPTHHYEHHRIPYSHSEATTPLSDRLLSTRNPDISYQTAVTSSTLSVGYLRSNLPFYPIAGQRHSHIHHPMPSHSGLCHSPTVGISSGNHHMVGGSGMAIPANASRYSSPPSLSIFTSRSGDSLLSGSESATDAPRSYSSRLGHGDGGRHSMKDSGRYSFTPSPSPCPSSQYSYSVPSPTASMDIPSSHFHPIRRLVPSHHTHHLHHSPVTTSFRPVDPAIEHYSFESGGTSTLPKRSQRIRIPSNPSVASKSSGGKLSTSSIEKSASVSERSSPLPAFTIEWLNADGTHPIATDYRGRKPEQGDLRNIYIEKSQEPLGIQISCGKGGGGIFVSSITEHSLAAQVGLQVGDQLLEVCGINMRSATYQLAANVLRQCGNSITMLVQYNPDKYEEAVLEMTSSSNEEDDDEEEEEEEDDDEESESDSPMHTPTSSPKLSTRTHGSSSSNQVASGGSQALPSAAPACSSLASACNLSTEDISSSATSTLTKQKVSSHNHSSSSSAQEKDKQPQAQGQQVPVQKGSPAVVSSSSSSTSTNTGDPRLLVLKKSTSHLGISLLGGNAVGIFVHSLQEDSPAGGNNGLHTGDQILEYNGVDLRQATAEEAAYELAKPADQITVLVQYNATRYSEIQDLPGDSFYVRALVDRSSMEGSLSFKKEDILFVDNTMFNGVPGLWRAWLLDQEGQKVKCGFIPSKYKLEEELLMKRSLGDLDGDGASRRGSTSARRSFFRRRKHQRSHSRDSSTAKELASFSDVSINSCTDSGNLGGTEDLLPPTYLRVERLDYSTMRPVILVGPLMEVVVDKLEQDYPHLFQRCIPEVMRGSQQMMERGLLELKLVDYRRRGSHFECTTLNAVREICLKNCHGLLDVCLTSVERLHRCQIYPIVIFLKFRSIKQIREVKDSRYLMEKVTTKAAKEMHEHSLKIESEHKHLINAVIPGSNLAYMCTQVKMCVEEEQCKTLWVPCQSASSHSFHNNNTSSSTTF